MDACRCTRLQNYWHILPHNLCGAHLRSSATCTRTHLRRHAISRTLHYAKPPPPLKSETNAGLPARTGSLPVRELINKSLVSFSLTISSSRLTSGEEGGCDDTADSSSLRHCRHHSKAKLLATINCWSRRRPSAFN